MSDTRDVVVQDARFDLAQTDPVVALQRSEKLVRYMADKCAGAKFVSTINGRNYPKVEWWTTVGAGLGLFPQEISSVKLEREGETVYEGTVEVRRGDQVISRASAICSDRESRWNGRDEYAIKSMATTRATGKAYRIAFSFLAVLAGLEPTPAEEIPEGEEPHAAKPTQQARPQGQRLPSPTCPKCSQRAPVMLSKFPEKGKWYCRDCKHSFNEHDVDDGPHVEDQDEQPTADDGTRGLF